MERKKFKKRFKMNTRSILSFIMLFALCLSAVWNISWADCRAQEKIMDESHKSIKVKPSDLYARSAVLMDAETGRILFGKNKDEQMPMASTTKIMTCILALENGNLSDKAEVSSVASAQPKVKLGMTQGQTFYLKDLLYSLMLESHNDCRTFCTVRISLWCKLRFVHSLNDLICHCPLHRFHRKRLYLPGICKSAKLCTL